MNSRVKKRHGQALSLTEITQRGEREDRKDREEREGGRGDSVVRGGMVAVMKGGGEKRRGGVVLYLGC